MHQFITSCRANANFPKNLPCNRIYSHTVDAYAQRLSERRSSLFCDETAAALDLWDYDETIQGFQARQARSLHELQEISPIPVSRVIRDPRCRFLFLHAPNSRERLSISHNMFTFAFTYHRVMPLFLDFVFPFGRQLYQQDFYFCAFRHETRVAPADRLPEIPELGRSGREVRLCYNLKSVETSEGSHWPWSVRQAAVYHAFDVENGHATWIILKANDLIKARLKAETQSLLASNASSITKTDQAFSLTLEVHLILCAWSSESWRWYINHLEEKLHEYTRRTVSVEVTRMPASEVSALGPNNQTSQLVTPRRRMRSLRPAITAHELASMEPQDPPELPPEPSKSPTHRGHSTFKFGDLQLTQFIEEKANEALLILKSNTVVLADLRTHYTSLTDSQDLPGGLTDSCREAVSNFIKRVAEIEDSMRMDLSRTELLLRLIADRKNLLYGILEYQSIEASQMFAEKAQLSAYNVEQMTREMRELTRKTKQETVSMRIITLVTLFFLPGTFISTLMSTDIVKYHISSTGSSERTVSVAALRLYISLSLPLMFATFVAWYVVYRWVNRP